MVLSTQGIFGKIEANPLHGNDRTVEALLAEHRKLSSDDFNNTIAKAAFALQAA